MARRRALRIAGITSFDFHRVLDGRSWNPAWRWHERRVPLVRVVSDDGACGIGEGWSSDNDTVPFHACASQVAPALLGANAESVEAIHARLWVDDDWAGAAVASAIDMALWDLLAHVRGLPLHALIGQSRRAVPVYASGGLYADGQTPRHLAEEMSGYIAQGFRAVKLKIGARGRADDLARVAAVREAVGPDVPIIVDALGRLPSATAAEWLGALAELGVTAIQAPLPLADMAGLAALQQLGTLTVIAGETEFRSAVLHALVQRRSVGMLQFCPGLCGGITGARRLAALAREAGIAVTPQCHGTAVLQAASLHLGAGCDNVATVEYHMFHDHLHAALPDGMRRLADGCVRLDDRPGLGIDTAALAGHGDGVLHIVATIA
jgi:L-alanine-DL-glutamate epimerase-like enolase superfamily enzyme